jgi:diaminohydroxyphosphoribosylaminopyrimidine deaminase/5-amino-6-(5-phosphoribosylamino)uracil reductase
VGAVLGAADGRIIGEGYPVRCGEGHAEVNAFASVRPEDEVLLSEATIYVSLEPCSHYGKTPPCADLIIRKGVRRCVVGCVDPFAAVQGRGIQKLRDAGIEVTVGVLEEECRELNRRFITFNEKRRPYIILKWAQTANAFLDDNGKACAISTPFTKTLVHKLRAENDAILVGRITNEREQPRLDVRHWAGKAPRRIVIDRRQPAFEGLHFSRCSHSSNCGMAAPGEVPVAHRGGWSRDAAPLYRCRLLGRDTRGDSLRHGRRRHPRSATARRTEADGAESIRRKRHQSVRAIRERSL